MSARENLNPSPRTIWILIGGAPLWIGATALVAAEGHAAALGTAYGAELVAGLAVWALSSHRSTEDAEDAEAAASTVPPAAPGSVTIPGEVINSPRAQDAA